MKEIKVKTTKTVNNYFDSETGELVKTDSDIKHDKIIVSGKEQFAVVYSSVISALAGLPGTANRGSGGGGGYDDQPGYTTTGGNGGKGIVIVQY